MDAILEELKSWGCDITGAMERFMDDKELYAACLDTVVEDAAFEKLGEALKAGQVKEAFDFAHTLKGVLANMGLTPLYDLSVKIVEPLRTGSCEGLMPVYEELLAGNEKLKRIIGK